MSEYTDVLIVGAGPAGLMASLSLSAMGIPHQVIDKLGTRALNGRADGFHVRTAEIWDSFGIAKQIEDHGSAFGEWTLWTPRSYTSQEIARQRREPVVGNDVSHKNTGTFHQGFIEASLIEAIKARNGPDVQRGVHPTSMSIDNGACGDQAAYPITVDVEHLRSENLEQWAVNAHIKSSDGQIKPTAGWIEAFGRDVQDTVPHVSGIEGASRTIHAKYLIGADGGHSWVRHQLPGFQMEGASSNSVWGVVDIVPITDFPDIRRNCTILSPHGTILIIPRERNLVRLYVQLDDNVEGGKKSSVGSRSAQETFAIAQKIFQPYSIDYRYCDWYTVYNVGQRVSNHFAYKDRIFLAGDAVHTHTPKGGQGMNVSQQDAYNLGWKLAGVLKGQLDPAVLSTYEHERRPLAKALIELDSAMSKVLTSRSVASEEEVREVYDRLRIYGSGVNITYPCNMIVSSPGACDISRATGLKLGQRMPQVPIVEHASGCFSSVHDTLKSNGAWRVFVFAGDLMNGNQLKRVNECGEKLSSMIAGFFPRPRDCSTGSRTLEVLLIHAGTTEGLEANDLHRVFYPFDQNSGHDYATVFGAKHILGLPTQNLYETFGINKASGAIVVVRPDQMVAWLGGLGDLEKLEMWFQGFMIIH